MRHLCFLLGLALLAPTAAYAASTPTSWNGNAGDRKLSTASNWSNGIPGPGKSATFTVAYAAPLTQDIDALTLDSIAFTGGGGGSFSLTGNAPTPTVTLSNGITTVCGLAYQYLTFPIALSSASQTWFLCSAVWQDGDLDLTSSFLQLRAGDSTNATIFRGAIKGTGSISVQGDPVGSVWLTGGTPNTFSGGLGLLGGATLVLDKPDGVVALPGPTVTVNSTVLYNHDEQIADTARLNINGAGLLRMFGHKETIGMLDLLGTVELGNGGVLTLAGPESMTLSGKIIGDSASKLVFNGSVSQTLSMSLTGTMWTGTLVVGGGKLLSSQDVAFSIDLGRGGVYTSAIIAGTYGAITVNNNAYLVAGTSNVPGIVNCGNLSLGTGSSYQPRLGGTVAGNLGSDRLNVTGTVTLAGGLDVATTYTPAPGDVITLISNDGADPVTGTFAGKPEGAIFYVGGFSGGYWQISYTGGDGNDVTLTKVAAPADMATPPDMTPLADMTPPPDMGATDDMTATTDDMTTTPDDVLDLAKPVDARVPIDLTVPSPPDMTPTGPTGMNAGGCAIAGASPSSTALTLLASLAALALLVRRGRRRAR